MPDLTTILSAETPLTLSGVPTGFQPSLLADLARAAKSRCVFIAPDEAAMRAIASTAAFFAPDLEIVQFPAWDCLPYDRASPTLRVMAERVAALHRLQGKLKGPQLLLTTANAVTQRVLTPFRVRQLVARLAPGERIGRDKLAMLLQANGYVRTDTVYDQGEYAVRGGIVDLYPSGEEQALRLDFFGDEIESVRTFDAQDQRTTGRIDGFVLLPASEALLDEESIKRFRSRYRETFGATATGDPLYQAVSEGRRMAGMEHWLPLFEDKMATLFDHLGADDVVVRDTGVAAAAESRFESVADYYENRQRAEAGQPGSFRPLVAKSLYLDDKEWAAGLAVTVAHVTTPFYEPESATVLGFGVDGPRDFGPERAAQTNVYESVVDHLSKLRKLGKRPILASYSVGARERLGNLLADHGLHGGKHTETWQEALAVADTARSAGVALVVLPLDHGYTAPGIAILTEQDMLGDRLVHRKKRKKSADAFLAELATLTPGDLVVHTEHGIGRYEGLTSIPVGKSPHDCVALSYAGGDKLYVPVENIDVLSRYGSSEEGATLDKLGGEGWQRRKSKMKERIREIAGELIATAAERALHPGDVLEPDHSGYPSFVDRFPYEETEDQDRAIEDVLGDLSAGKPMDRLIVGDVGFGKTEVALRAAFVAAMGGKQVAVVCPTTLLARQHYNNFVSRFEGFPMNMGRLSRLVTASEAKATREGLANGTIDVVIGTHALLAKTIDFKRLGLVIVDEEQRFGVTHKERLKGLRADVHMLTLTATPIPRTLQMAMSGIRELSVIQTPPVDRLAVRTYIMPFDPVVLREALLREHYRGGQSFVVTPRVADLPDIEDFLRQQVPEIRFVVAHGQMSPTEVEERMSAFYDKKFEVLVSTTIIESGIDIASANTMIVHRADRFGLAQLYQLRGRVGRSKTRAYAYLVTPPERQMSVTAEKRLKVLSDLDSLGAGFQLASHDLDIRGAGNMLGDEQTGHIKEVGFELYQAMLEEAIMDAKSGGLASARPKDFSPQITVDAPILIPEEYVPDLDLRMGLYRRLNELEEGREIEAFAAEMIDRFGPLPDATDNLIRVIEIKLNAKRACVSKIDVGPKGVLVSFHNDTPPNIEKLLAYVERLNGVARLRPDSKLVLQRAWGDPKARLHGALQLSKGLAKAAG
ncbi:transcription-repair coupling factor [Sphingomonas ginsenosidivorax]|uniref:Transcription-repair-coupling factor n=1 Tax=Sphingomonas ginsenosidivorax TaxID=862135 RepID=A0A5C6UF27_9SPHN|nr:transcription-repair coupling factor [Sphingomonas ginsenosidivorax]TXC70655.1 transcription-repair coupling factor [Sphingomonas ginsenosidivorax]